MFPEIDFWSERHVPWLEEALMTFLQSNLTRGGDVLATEKNVQTLLETGVKGARAGDPCLVALVDSLYAGFVFWTGLPSGLETKWKTIHAIGSFTEPFFRSRGVADYLRKEALRIAGEKGFRRIVGPVYFQNSRGVREFIYTYDAWPVSVSFEKFIEEG